MSTIEFNLADSSKALEDAIIEFIKAEFKSDQITIEKNTKTDAHKDLSTLAINVGIVITVVGSFEGTLQFAERIKRLERVKKLSAAIKASGQTVYLKISGKDPVDLSTKTADETMDILAEEKEH